MKLDETLKGILVDVQNELRVEDINISIEELANIVSSPFVASTFAFKKGLEVRLPFFGTFVRKDLEGKIKAAEELMQLKGVLSKEEYDRKVLETKLLHKEKAKQKRKNNSLLKIDINLLKQTDNITRQPHKYDKIINET